AGDRRDAAQPDDAGPLSERAGPARRGDCVAGHGHEGASSGSDVPTTALPLPSVASERRRGAMDDPVPSITAARAASSSASPVVGGHIGLKLYHCCGAAAIVDWRESAIAWVARATS